MDHHAGHNHASSGSHHGDHMSHDHVTVLPATTPHPHNHHQHHNHAEHVRAATTASTLQIPTPDGTDWFHGTTEGLNSHDHNHHHLHSHGNDLDLNSENVPGDHNHGDHLQSAAGEAHGDMMHHGMGHMKPIFKWVTDSQVLFEQWTTTTIIELALAMLAAAFLAAMYELVRNWLSTWDSNHRSYCSMPWWKRMCLHSFRSVMHALTAAIGYVQMLFAMTYDLRIFVAIILGSGLGFLVLGPYFRTLTLQQKQQRTRTGKELTNGGNVRSCKAPEKERILIEEENANNKQAGDWPEGQTGVDESEMQMILARDCDRESVV